MPITSISRDWGIDPQIVRIVTTDLLSLVTSDGYWLTQLNTLNNIQHGDFEWRDSDLVLIKYLGGIGFFTYEPITGSFLMNGVFSNQTLVTSAQIKAMSVTPVLMVPAPGAGKLVVVGRNTYIYKFLTAQYTGGGALGLEFGNTAALAGPAASTTLAGATFDAYAASNTFELTPDNTNVLADVEGLGIYLSNDTAAFATGSGTLLVNLEFQVVDTV